MRAVALACMLLPATAAAHDYQIFDIGPSDDWCAVLHTLAGAGDVVRLAPGVYPGGCTITRGGIAEEQEPTLVIGADPADLPVLSAADGPTVVVAAPLIRLSLLAFDPPPAGVPAVSVTAGGVVRVDRCRFDSGGVRVSAAESAPVLVDNRFDGADISIDCDGCEVVIGSNEVTGGRIVVDGAGLIRDNRVDGGDITGAIGVELAGNAVIAGTIDVGPGSVVHSNVVLGGVLRVHERGEVLGNTVIAETGRGLALPGWTAGTVQGNAVAAWDGPGALPSAAGPHDVACPTPEDCWRDPGALDLHPRCDRALDIDRVAPLERDFCGVQRDEEGLAGAIARRAGDVGALQPAFKRDLGCSDACPTPAGCAASTLPAPATPGPLGLAWLVWIGLHRRRVGGI